MGVAQASQEEIRHAYSFIYSLLLTAKESSSLSSLFQCSELPPIWQLDLLSTVYQRQKGRTGLVLTYGGFPTRRACCILAYPCGMICWGLLISKPRCRCLCHGWGIGLWF